MNQAAKNTIIAMLMLMAAYFLVLHGGVGFIQDKRFFSSAPKENPDAIPDQKERSRGAHIVGWAIKGEARFCCFSAPPPLRGSA